MQSAVPPVPGSAKSRAPNSVGPRALFGIAVLGSASARAPNSIGPLGSRSDRGAWLRKRAGSEL
eukprot:7359338-Alexandrium_andersonii.AAC.1